jgi:hypothetical protein
MFHILFEIPSHGFGRLSTNLIEDSARAGARNNDLITLLLFREQSENRIFRFARSEKAQLDFLRPYQECTLQNLRR